MDYKNKEDICAHLGDDYSRFLGAIVPPIFQTTLFTNTDKHGYVYTRVSNPTTEIVEGKIAALEEGEAAKCFSSGMAAISAAIMRAVRTGSHVICPITVYGGTKHFLTDYLPRFQVETTFVPGDSIEDFERAIRPNTHLIYLESPSSNLFALQDLQALAQLARERGITTIADNTWATPLYQNPLALGIDMVVHSASKYLGGHSDVTAGAAAGKSSIMNELAGQERQLYGAVMDPHSSWLLLRGIRTLPVRMSQHQESAMKAARFLEAHPKVERVFYPGLPSHPQYDLGLKQMTGYTGLLSFMPIGRPERIIEAVKSMRYFQFGPSWGGFESLVMTYGMGASKEETDRMGIPGGLVRISVGLEHAESLLEDLEHALSKI
ncbi:trans-sulfuration enzyme family protein [Paenibacillus montanisoli]|uniref:homocysteine desulfhydrase n=1 Tax=Paenibacillus montanisoli TaxID=2081970 RepID=A0A328U1C3_9BACL|nr:PLP-dependent aspartate aminotransferase family protein [Paenibacillus montanisoli]RAP76567.1 cystathionine beta-lyase/cystathionine gamma-synthase [Paenibacillus montanisoli]